MAQPAQIHPEIRKMYEQIQVHLQEMRTVQQKKTKQVEMRHQLGAQQNENELVRDELNRLEPGAGVYKLIGPALISQNQTDAKMIVEKRLEYIHAELKRVDSAIDGMEKAEDGERGKIGELQRRMNEKQQQLQQQQQQQQQAAANQ